MDESSVALHGPVYDLGDIWNSTCICQTLLRVCQLETDTPVHISIRQASSLLCLHRRYAKDWSDPTMHSRVLALTMCHCDASHSHWLHKSCRSPEPAALVLPTAVTAMTEAMTCN